MKHDEESLISYIIDIGTNDVKINDKGTLIINLINDDEIIIEQKISNGNVYAVLMSGIIEDKVAIGMNMINFASALANFNTLLKNATSVGVDDECVYFNDEKGYIKFTKNGNAIDICNGEVTNVNVGVEAYNFMRGMMLKYLDNNNQK